MRRLACALLLPLLLILAQQGALVHELGHVAERLQQAGAPDQEPHDAGYCDKCFFFAHLSGTLAAAACAAMPAPSTDECAGLLRPVEPLAEPSARRIRGPPVDL